MGTLLEDVFDSAQLPVGDRAEAWAELTARALITTRIKFLNPAECRAGLQAMPLGAPHMSVMSYTPLFSQRTPKLIRQSDPEHYQMALIRRGHQGIEQNRTRTLLGPGQLVFYDSSRPFDAVTYTDQADPEAIVLQFPKWMLPLPEQKVTRLLAEPLSGTQGVGRLYAQFLNSLIEEHLQCTPRDAARLGHTAVDLATAVLGHHLDDEMTLPVQSPQRVLFLRITAFINQHLPAPELRPATIAAAHQISLRYLHRIFQLHGTSVNAYIKRQRLDRCRRDLADPELHHLTIEAIAARWGFPRLTDFSRAFRAAVGVPPSQYRTTILSAHTPLREP
ncbi:AraC-like ligand-binding domain-containing protein [Streptomyces mayonensis]|uniref:AraC-like ligand-binding domain-containing protein n=1 Tax=Streptomyces mayonensis TaxID=2750816 RepID=UPI001C1E766F|nr:helix-turn-helix domain-containing protein [Streptomyces sp. A108]MBU6533866.1 helix-turn-helix domain-containing protein [Streptomyces sp. A108]